jgi:hypothetical protein
MAVSPRKRTKKGMTAAEWTPAIAAELMARGKFLDVGTGTEKSITTAEKYIQKGYNYYLSARICGMTDDVNRAVIQNPTLYNTVADDINRGNVYYYALLQNPEPYARFREYVGSFKKERKSRYVSPTGVPGESTKEMLRAFLEMKPLRRQPEVPGRPGRAPARRRRVSKTPAEHITSIFNKTFSERLDHYLDVTNLREDGKGARSKAIATMSRDMVYYYTIYRVGSRTLLGIQMFQKFYPDFKTPPVKVVTPRAAVLPTFPTAVPLPALPTTAALPALPTAIPLPSLPTTAVLPAPTMPRISPRRALPTALPVLPTTLPMISAVSALPGTLPR